MEPTTSVITDQLTRAALGISVCPAHSSPMVKLHYQRTDYSVVVKNRAPPRRLIRFPSIGMGRCRLQQISHILQVPVTFFFDGAPHVPTAHSRETPRHLRPTH